MALRLRIGMPSKPVLPGCSFCSTPLSFRGSPPLPSAAAWAQISRGAVHAQPPTQLARRQDAARPELSGYQISVRHDVRTSSSALLSVKCQFHPMRRHARRPRTQRDASRASSGPKDPVDWLARPGLHGLLTCGRAARFSADPFANGWLIEVSALPSCRGSETRQPRRKSNTSCRRRNLMVQLISQL